MNNKNILKIAMKQSAIDNNCEINDFLSEENKIVYSNKNEKARVYLELPHFCNLISYGNNIVASIDRLMEKDALDYICKYSIEHCFETPNLHVLNEKLLLRDMKICFMAEYFLPDMTSIKPQECDYELRELDKIGLSKLETSEWSNALSREEHRHLDVLGIGAYDNNCLVGLAACSMDCESMWQIGVDVKPDFRKRCVGSTLTSNLAISILDRGIVPFYCCAWSNIKSTRNAIKSGFKPAWVEMTAKKISFVDKLNE